MTGLDGPGLDGRGLDWPGLMRAGLGGLRLQPAEFWDLTPLELQLLLGPAVQAPSLTRSGLQALMQRFPDQPDLPPQQSEHSE
ncbi:rcc01693 family protein [Pseudophaeobacter sp.]|uniref:rcc01693 family protein n=1 Tax=Pseudophaeobacter sp. TaxID=1971739 RepID=UPI00261DACBA|nr:rcc01693 family protein [Pseudophaeobacter sp.]